MPQVATQLVPRDHLGTIGARTGAFRNNYKVTPGLYCTEGAGKQSPVLVTANYKLSFDALRKELTGVSAWILVIDTRGINVWCAGGKGTFSAEEIAYQVQQARLNEIVEHRKLIIPQLAANGVALHKLKNLCGFRGELGPVRASHIKQYIETGADESMRAVTFPLKDRAELIPYEIFLLWKPLPVLLVLFFALSSISKNFIDLGLGFERGALLFGSTLWAIVTGTIITPLALPYVPFRQFWLKGAAVGIVGAVFFLLNWPGASLLESVSLLLWMTGCSSYLAMNFTGSTVFTSLSGVEKEMRAGLPFQVITGVLSLLFWVVAPFIS